ARLGGGDVALDGAADAPPEIDAPARIGREVDRALAAGAAAAAGADRGAARGGDEARAARAALARARSRAGHRERGEKSRARFRHHRARLPVSRLGGTQILVRDVDRALE